MFDHVLLKVRKEKPWITRDNYIEKRGRELGIKGEIPSK
jgi:hypothetical protein